MGSKEFLELKPWIFHFEAVDVTLAQLVFNDIAAICISYTQPNFLGYFSFRIDPKRI